MFQLGHACGEPPKLPNSQRFGSVTRTTYECNDGYTGGGAATCWHGVWKLNGSCNSKCQIMNPPAPLSSDLR